MTRGHKTILLLVTWLAFVVVFVAALIVPMPSRYLAGLTGALTIGLGIACIAIILVPTTKGFPPGHCEFCGYDLTGNQSGRCSECGALTAGTAAPAPPNPSFDQHAPAS